jgi:acetylornithine deacetylase/succinyl-diaminopimelate desuccinylase-like protein
MIDSILKTLDDNLEASLARLCDFLKIASVSTDPAYKDETRKGAQWIAGQLQELGFDVSIIPTQGHPMVVAHWKGKVDKPDAPHCLFYGHYDVQPADPEALWDSPPFAPVIKTSDDGNRYIVARGADDNKGQLMTFVEAFRATLAVTGSLPVPVTVFLEGEEESGSPSLVPFLKEHGDLLKADVAFVCDTSRFDEETPAITLSLRGLMGEEITLTGPNRDLHSGYYGGAARNPLHVLTHILGQMHDEDGRVTIPGFYDDVLPMPKAVLEQWQRLDFDEKRFLGDVGLSVPAGPADKSVLECVWSEPTLEINGLSGGYTGEGFKTVLPSKAYAKISCRLVNNQDPDKLRQALRHFIESRVPEDCHISFKPHGGSPGIVMALDSPAMAATRQALDEEWQTETAMIGMGGSIPVVHYMKDILQLDSILVGFGLEDDRIHSPDEKYDVKSYHKGMRSWARILQALKEM